jgi:hypothetical protein
MFTNAVLGSLALLGLSLGFLNGKDNPFLSEGYDIVRKKRHSLYPAQAIICPSLLKKTKAENYEIFLAKCYN